MSTRRACVACRTAKAKCDSTHPTCRRCAQKGLVCFIDASQAAITFHDENEVAKRNSQRARRGRPAATSPVKMLVRSPDEAPPAAGDIVSQPDLQAFWWLNRSALAQVPEPLKKDVETRAVERFFVNWILHPSNHGTTPGYMHELPWLFQNAKQDSVLWLAVRAVAFADMRNGHAGAVPFHVKARQHYGAALTGMRAIISTQQDLGDDNVLFAMLLIDNFELMYLARNNPFSAHSQAIRHVLQRRGVEQLYSPTRFSLWRLTHYRLQAWQTLAREQPAAQQIEWLDKLDMERPALRICSHVLHMNILSASAKVLTQSRVNDPSARLDYLNQAEKLVLEMQHLIVNVENWASEMAQVWSVKEDDPESITVRREVQLDGSPQFPIPHFPYPRLITYDDIWLAYIWNFYAASQIVLRESLVDVLEYAASLRTSDELDGDSAAAIQNQREWVDVLSAAILKSFPQLLGFVYRRQGHGTDQQQGRMAGRLFALFSMWVVQMGKFTSEQHKQTASEVVKWIHSRHELG